MNEMKNVGQSLISLFARHPVAANLLMILMFLSGVWGYKTLNTELLPKIELPFVTVSIVWPGASPEDVENALAIPVEKQLQSIDGLKNLYSYSRRNVLFVFMEFSQDENLSEAVNEVRRQINSLRNMPDDIESAVVRRIERYDTIARVVLKGGHDKEELRQLAFKLRSQLLSVGFAKVDVSGLGTNELSIKVPQETLTQLKSGLSTIGNHVISRNINASGGSVGRYDLPQQLRAKNRRESVMDAESIMLNLNKNTGLLQLNDIASLSFAPKEGQVSLYSNEKPVVSLRLYRTFSQDTLTLSKKMNKWLKVVKERLPKGVSISTYDERWRLIDQRIEVLARNAGLGFLLVFLSLSLFLNIRIAFWVALGIPIAYFGSLLVLGSFDLTINMLTLFAFIITVGIVVDDAIVVGEETATQFKKGKSALEASILGAKRMFVPVICSSLTTITTLLPLFLIGGFIGALMMEIPLAIICVIIASLVECFLILPGHLHHSLKKMKQPSALRLKLDRGFEVFREGVFRSFIVMCMKNRLMVISLVMVAMLLTVGLYSSKRVKFTFFPQMERTIVAQVVDFAEGTSPETMKAFMFAMQKALYKVNDRMKTGDENVVKESIIYLGAGVNNPRRGDSETRASINVELVDTNERDFSNIQFIRAWKRSYQVPSYVESITIRQRRSGPSAADIEIDLSGADYNTLKKAALKLGAAIEDYHGVSNVMDNLNIGQEELVYTLTDQAKKMGLSSESVTLQLNRAYAGRQLHVIHLPNHEIEVKMSLLDKQKHSIDSLAHFPIMTDKGQAVPFGLVVNTKVIQGFSALRHTNSEPTVEVSADVDENMANRNMIISKLKREVIPKIKSEFKVEVKFSGLSVEQRETIRDMSYGAIIALALIYIIMAWVFGSYIWPLSVMFAIPFGLVGAVFGHYLLGYNISIWSLFGFFALSGIVVNDSIILIIRYKELKKKLAAKKAIVEACCQRLRAVILTSLTTMAGLLPALFDTSLSTQFLVPIAITMVFGMAFATLLTLVFIPVLLSLFDRAR